MSENIDPAAIDIGVLNQRGISAFQAGEHVTAVKYFAAAANTLEGGIGAPEQHTIADLVNRNLMFAAKSAGNTELLALALKRIVQLTPSDLGAWAQLDQLERAEIGARLIALEGGTSGFVSSHIRPKRADAVGVCPAKASQLKIAMVLQGPLLLEHHFTVETIKLYRKLFPDLSLVVSTWVGESGDEVESLRRAGAHVLQNEKPSIAGNGNVNMQLVSAQAGIAYAHDIGCQYILKSRTDYRIYDQHFFLNAMSLFSAFPLSENCRAQQRDRILIFDDMNLYRLYTVHDRNMFGSATDMLNYWSAPLDQRSDLGKGESPLDLAKAGVCESYYLARYMELLNRPLHWTLDDYWDILKDYFIVMDHGAADMYWCKHNRYAEYRMRHYSFDSNFAVLGFHEWLRISQGQQPFAGDARIFERRSGASISDVLTEWNNQAKD
jgi:hypothetical protein